jgi:hypothetical protein
MALADPQVIPGTPVLSLARVSVQLGNFGSADSTYELTIDHTSGTRARHLVKLTQRKIAADPFLTTQNREFAQSIHLLANAPKQGYTNTEVVALWDRFAAYIATGGLAAAIIAGQA